MEVSHYFYDNYGWTDILFQGPNYYVMAQDYTSTSIGKHTQKLSYSYTFGRWEAYGENIRSSSAGEYSTGVRYSITNLTLGGDGRIIVGNRTINNSGLTFEYRGKVLRFNGELRPLLRYGDIHFTPSINLRGQTLGLLTSYSRAHYRLPSYSEDLTAYEVSPYVRGKVGTVFPITYDFGVGYSGREYPLTPMKSYTTYYVGGGASTEIPTSLFLHRFKVEGRLNRYNYIGLNVGGDIPLGIEERSAFEYAPIVMDVFKLNFAVNRTLKLYSGILKDRSSVYRNVLVGGEMELKGFNVYLRRRREDNVLLHRSRSSDTRTLLRYVLGLYRTMGTLVLSSEISAIYTLYRFKPEDNSLYRYLDGEVRYEGRGEINVRVRMWDRGRYVSDSVIYYRLLRGVELYSSGWVPVARIGRTDVGLSYDIKPDGEAVGVRAVYPGGEVMALRRYENDHLFWQVSLRFSQTF